jgi:ABC-type lipoprotein release transport system permease subunit
MIFKIAVRNMFRNRWRSGLTAGGIAVAVGLCIWTLCYIEGFVDAMIRGLTGVELGQAQIHTAEYAERPSLFDHFAEDGDLMERVTAVEGVVAAAPRVHAFGLIGHETRSQVGRLVGIDPVLEPRVTVLNEGVVEGRWLGPDPVDEPTIRELLWMGGDVLSATRRPLPTLWAFALEQVDPTVMRKVRPVLTAREILVGEDFAEQLDIGLGAELVIFLQAADGGLFDMPARVVGILRTGNSVTDRQTVFLNIADMQYAASMEGQIHEVALQVADYQKAEAVAAAVQAAINVEREESGSAAEGQPELVAEAWQDLIPEVSQMIELNNQSIWLIYVMIYLVVALGILNTQRMSALERRREFGVLMAVGLKPRRLGALIVVETVALTLVGAVIGALLGYAVSKYHTEVGLDLGAFSQQDSFSFMGLSFSERLYFKVTTKAVFQPVLVIVGVAVFCGLWPAFTSARLKITQAISGRN